MSVLKFLLSVALLTGCAETKPTDTEPDELGESEESDLTEEESDPTSDEESDIGERTTRDACEDYIAAWDECYEEYFEANDLGEYTSTLEGTCDSVVDNPESTWLYDCYTEAVREADCSALEEGVDISDCS